MWNFGHQVSSALTGMRMERCWLCAIGKHIPAGTARGDSRSVIVRSWQQCLRGAGAL